MSITLLMSCDVLDVHHDQDNAWLYLDWKGPQGLALVQATCPHVLAFIEQTGANKILNDNTHITHTNWELAKWVAYHYLPWAGASGLDYVAWVQSPLPSCRGYIYLMDEFVNQKPQVVIFDDLAGAYAWLSSANTTVAALSLKARTAAQQASAAESRNWR